MRMKIGIAILLCIVSVLICPACSYVELENKIHRKIDGNSNEPITVEAESTDFAKVEMLGIGETMDGSWKLTSKETQETIMCGEPGLTYTLNGIEIFDSIYSSGIDKKETTMDTDNQNYERDFADNAFILVDMTATYHAPNGEDEICASILFAGYCDEEKLGKDFLEIKGQTYKRKPYVIYFSNHPTADDPRLDPEGQYDNFYIKNGEALNFKLGIITAQEFIDSKNVLLALGNISVDPSVATQDINGRIFDLFK